MTNKVLATFLLLTVAASLLSIVEPEYAMTAGVGLLIFIPWSVIRLWNCARRERKNGEQLGIAFNEGLNALFLGFTFAIYLVMVVTEARLPVIMSWLLMAALAWTIVNLYRNKVNVLS